MFRKSITVILILSFFITSTTYGMPVKYRQETLRSPSLAVSKPALRDATAALNRPLGSGITDLAIRAKGVTKTSSAGSAELDLIDVTIGDMPFRLVKEPLTNRFLDTQPRRMEDIKKLVDYIASSTGETDWINSLIRGNAGVISGLSADTLLPSLKTLPGEREAHIILVKEPNIEEPRRPLAVPVLLLRKEGDAHKKKYSVHIIDSLSPIEFIKFISPRGENQRRERELWWEFIHRPFAGFVGEDKRVMINEMRGTVEVIPPEVKQILLDFSAPTKASSAGSEEVDFITREFGKMRLGLADTEITRRFLETQPGRAEAMGSLIGYLATDVVEPERLNIMIRGAGEVAQVAKGTILPSLKRLPGESEAYAILVQEPLIKTPGMSIAVPVLILRKGSSLPRQYSIHLINSLSPSVVKFLYYTGAGQTEEGELWREFMRRPLEGFTFPSGALDPSKAPEMIRIIPPEVEQWLLALRELQVGGINFELVGQRLSEIFLDSQPGRWEALGMVVGYFSSGAEDPMRINQHMSNRGSETAEVARDTLYPSFVSLPGEPEAHIIFAKQPSLERPGKHIAVPVLMLREGSNWPKQYSMHLINSLSPATFMEFLLDLETERPAETEPWRRFMKAHLARVAKRSTVTQLDELPRKIEVIPPEARTALLALSASAKSSSSGTNYMQVADELFAAQEMLLGVHPAELNGELFDRYQAAFSQVRRRLPHPPAILENRPDLSYLPTIASIQGKIDELAELSRRPAAYSELDGMIIFDPEVINNRAQRRTFVAMLKDEDIHSALEDALTAKARSGRPTAKTRVVLLNDVESGRVALPSNGNAILISNKRKLDGVKLLNIRGIVGSRNGDLFPAPYLIALARGLLSINEDNFNKLYPALARLYTKISKSPVPPKLETALRNSSWSVVKLVVHLIPSPDKLHQEETERLQRLSLFAMIAA